MIQNQLSIIIVIINLLICSHVKNAILKKMLSSHIFSFEVLSNGNLRAYVIILDISTVYVGNLALYN